MSTSKPQKRRLSLPWSRKKSLSTPVTSGHLMIRGLTAAPQPQSALLQLPVELQIRIFSYILTPWTMAIIPGGASITDDDTDPTLNLEQISSKSLSGPRGAPLLIVCRHIYNLVQDLNNSTCTGIFLLGRIPSTVVSGLSAYLAGQCKLQRYFQQIRTLKVSISWTCRRLISEFRAAFPQLQHVECIIDAYKLGPYLRVGGLTGDTEQGFLTGSNDAQFRSQMAVVERCFLGERGSSEDALPAGSCPFNDEGAVAVIKVVGDVMGQSLVKIGFHYRWQGSTFTIVSRVVRHWTRLSYWEEGMNASDTVALSTTKEGPEVPVRFRWVPVVTHFSFGGVSSSAAPPLFMR